MTGWNLHPLDRRARPSSPIHGHFQAAKDARKNGSFCFIYDSLSLPTFLLPQWNASAMVGRLGHFE